MIKVFNPAKVFKILIHKGIWGDVVSDENYQKQIITNFAKNQKYNLFL